MIFKSVKDGRAQEARLIRSARIAEWDASNAQRFRTKTSNQDALGLRDKKKRKKISLLTLIQALLREIRPIQCTNKADLEPRPRYLAASSP